MNAISVQNLSKKYGNGSKAVQALDDVSFDVPEKSIYGFIGPNGAGKSTTIGIILQFLFQDSGKVFLFDEEVDQKNLSILKQKIGFIPDADLPNITGIKFLKHTAYYHGLQGSSLKEHLRNLLDLTESRSFIGRNTKKLSKGQKSRIKIANALIGDPSLIIADEPTAGLDPVARRQFLSMISRLRDDGVSIFFSNHIIGEVEKICDQVAMLSKGHIVANGSIDKIIHSLPVKNRFNVVVQNISQEELRKLPNVKNVEQRSNFEFIVETIDSNSGVPEFIKELVQKPVIFESVSRENINLEDIFLSVVNNTGR